MDDTTDIGWSGASGGTDRFRTLFDAIDEGFALCEMIVDAEGRPVDYRFLDTNPLFEEMTGLTDAVGRTAKELVPDLEPHWVDRYASVGLGRKPIRFQEGSDAMGRWFDVFSMPIESEGRFAIVFKDDTARHLAESELRRNVEEFRALTNQLPLIVWAHDATGRQEFVNDTFLRYFGTTRDELASDGWQLLAHPDDGSRYVDDFLAAVAERRPFHNEVRARAADGEWRWLESWGAPRFGADGSFLGHIGTSADITDRKEAERILAEGAAFTRRVLDNLFTFAGVLSLDGTVITANRAPLEGAGLELDDVVGRKFWDCHWWSYSPEVAGELEMAAARAARGEAVRYDAVVRMRGDSRLSIDFQIAPLFAEDGTISHLVVSGLDLTPRKSAEAALEAALEKEARGRARAELLARVLSEVESAGTVDQQLQRLADLLVPQVADFVSVEAPAERDHLLVVRHVDPGKVETLRTLRLRHRLGPEHPSSMWNVSKGRPQTRTEATAGEHQLDQTTAELLERLGVSSHVAVPLALGAGVEGSLLCGLSRGERRPYDDEDLAFVAEIAERVGLIVAANRAREREHAFSLRLQKALLPERLRIHPEIDVVARYEAASDQLEVGGDWYDTFVWPGGEYGVVVGDVVGHGIEAAAAMGRLRAAGGILIMAGPPDPAAILEVLDRCCAWSRRGGLRHGVLRRGRPDRSGPPVRIGRSSAGPPAEGRRNLGVARSGALAGHLLDRGRSADVGLGRSRARRRRALLFRRSRGTPG